MEELSKYHPLVLLKNCYTEPLSNSLTSIQLFNSCISNDITFENFEGLLQSKDTIISVYDFFKQYNFDFKKEFDKLLEKISKPSSEEEYWKSLFYLEKAIIYTDYTNNSERSEYIKSKIVDLATIYQEKADNISKDIEVNSAKYLRSFGDNISIASLEIAKFKYFVEYLKSADTDSFLLSIMHSLIGDRKIDSKLNNDFLYLLQFIVPLEKTMNIPEVCFLLQRLDSEFYFIIDNNKAEIMQTTIDSVLDTISDFIISDAFSSYIFSSEFKKECTNKKTVIQILQEKINILQKHSCLVLDEKLILEHFHQELKEEV